MTDTAARPWRLFIALPMAAVDAARLEAVIWPYRTAFPGAGWQRPDAFHVTLRFLGPTAPGRVEGLVQEMRACARRQTQFRMTTGRGQGVMRASGGVCWLRIDRGHEQAVELSRCLAGQTARVSSTPSAVPPHLTLARRAEGPLIDALAGGTLGEPVVEWRVDRIVLFRSHTGTPAGSTYEALASVPFGPGATAS